MEFKSNLLVVLVLLSIISLTIASKDHKKIKRYLFLFEFIVILENNAHFKKLLKPKIYTSTNDPESTVLNLIKRVIGSSHDVNDFVIKFKSDLNADNLDTFQVNEIDLKRLNI